ncbi:single-stranded DNA-binding protein [Spirulina major CS-329]|jgi:single-strand DNA-binding protein|uniref:single-stranded DNA-binding protein n=1 Tax=Spirulina TaxID=1154 RepID=UPI002331096B|nr:MULTISPECIES: single-stranded DNA-binding protein [Spirulina]MDB9495827.1 single-stranded DNA-binding protein [Spirulina subsalsa CS-330]MDB9505470.1 single-stranded DNA-binding protein [Spirulina major CS-329]
MSLNIVNLVGRAGADPDVRYFESGSVLCELPLAVDRRTSRDDKPDWFNLKIWGKTAEVAANYVRKGKLLGIQGELVIETWQDSRTGTERSKPVIRVIRMDLLGSKRDDAAGAAGYTDYGSGGEF